MKMKITFVLFVIAFLLVSTRRRVESPMSSSLLMEFTEETVGDHQCKEIERQLEKHLYSRLTGRGKGGVDFDSVQASALCAERSSYQKILEKYRILARSVAHEI